MIQAVAILFKFLKEIGNIIAIYGPLAENKMNRDKTDILHMNINHNAKKIRGEFSYSWKSKPIRSLEIKITNTINNTLLGCNYGCLYGEFISLIEQ